MSCDSILQRYRPPVSTAPETAGRVLTSAHQGNAQAFLDRHNRECSRYGRGTAAERQLFARQLVTRIADERNLMLAALHLADGDKAPGPNGQRLARLLREAPQRVWAECRRLKALILSSAYIPGPVRRLDIPKSSGRGTRPIEIANWQDLVVQRAIVQILQPLLDPQFDDRSFGYRPGRNRCDALDCAAELVERTERHVVITADLKDAFTHVPHNPLLEQIQRLLGNDQLTELIRSIMWAGGRGRGVAQGGCLSPLLLNLHLDLGLDRRWRQRHPDIPLIRVADDLLVLTRTIEEAQLAYSTLRELVRPIGMVLKGNPDSDLHDLGNGDEAADWLGLRLTVEHNRLTPRISARFVPKLHTSLQLALNEGDGVLHAHASVLGVIDQLAPCYPFEDQDHVLCQITATARSLGIGELPSLGTLHTRWEKAYRDLAARRRTRTLRSSTATSALVTEPSRGSSDSRVLGQGSAAGHANLPSLVGADATHVVLTLTSVQLPPGSGSWASCWTTGSHLTNDAADHARGERRMTPYRLELTALLLALERIGDWTALEVVTACPPLAHGLARGLRRWVTFGGIRRCGRQVPHWDLWQAIDVRLAGRRVTVRCVPEDHSDPHFRECRRRAVAAAEQCDALLNLDPGGPRGREACQAPRTE